MLLHKQYGDFVVRRTSYYPSGVPMAQSMGQDGSGLGKPAARTLCVWGKGYH